MLAGCRSQADVREVGMAVSSDRPVLHTVQIGDTSCLGASWHFEAGMAVLVDYTGWQMMLKWQASGFCSGLEPWKLSSAHNTKSACLHKNALSFGRLSAAGQRAKLASRGPAKNCLPLQFGCIGLGLPLKASLNSRPGDTQVLDLPSCQSWLNRPIGCGSPVNALEDWWW